MRCKAVLTAVLLAVFSLLPAGRAAAEEAAPATEPEFVVFYLHTTFRCYSCNMIEAITKMVVEGDKIELNDGRFITPPPLLGQMHKDGRLAFRALNTDEEENKHYLADLKTREKIPVIARIKDGKIVAVKSLPDVWKLLKNPDEFVKYVDTEATAFIKENGK